MTLSTICSNTGMALLFLLAAVVSAQQISPSNNSADIPPYNSSPRFWINGSDFDSFEVVPLGWYQSISQSGFRNMMYEGRLQHVDGSNANNPLSDAIVYIRCDPDAYNGVLGASDILTMAANAQPTNPIVVYSTESNHCAASNLRSLSANNGVFSTLDPVLAATVESQIRNKSSGVPCTVTPDLNSYQSASSNGYGSSSSSNGNGRPGPTTAVAMIVLYTITGLITALFVCIIITGAVRAHRHPERYGPMNSPGRARRSRAKGIARAMLDTIPIVKFGEKDESATAKKEAGDVELASVASVHTDETANAKPVASAITESEQPAATSAPSAATANADGTDESGQLGCSICTEDFTRGEEVRVLPCNHKFHPECVDPWLLNVSGTCPLCRVDLRPREEQDQRDSIDGEARRPSGNALDDFLAPPLGGRRASNANGRRDTTAFAALRSVVAASREDRIAALRRYRQQRRENGASAQQGEEGGRVTRRLRERFRIRTRRQGEDTAEEVRS